MRLPTPGVRSTGRARRVRPQHEPQETCAPTHRGLPELKGESNGLTHSTRVSRSCLVSEGLRAHNL